MSNVNVILRWNDQREEIVVDSMSSRIRHHMIELSNGEDTKFSLHAEFKDKSIYDEDTYIHFGKDRIGDFVEARNSRSTLIVRPGSRTVEYFLSKNSERNIKIITNGFTGTYLGDVGDDMDSLCYVLYDEDFIFIEKLNKKHVEFIDP